MRKINWSVEMSTVYSAKTDGTIEVEDDATDEEIDHLVREEVFNIVSWGWSEEEKAKP